MLVPIGYLLYAMVIFPNSSTVCRGSDRCPIEWDSQIDAHIEMQISNNNTWTSVTDEGKSYFSVIVDRTTKVYDWLVPQYITHTWKNPKRIVLTDLYTSQHFYSDEFTITGVSIYNSFPEKITSSTHVPIKWQSNENTTFGIYLLNNGNIIDTIESAKLPQNYTYLWNVPYRPLLDMTVMVRSIDNKTYDLSSSFQIATTTRQTSSTSTSSTSSTSSSSTSTSSTSSSSTSTSSNSSSSTSTSSSSTSTSSSSTSTSSSSTSTSSTSSTSSSKTKTTNRYISKKSNDKKGIQWWLLLIIVVACILSLIFLSLCYIKKTTKPPDNSIKERGFDNMVYDSSNIFSGRTITNNMYERNTSMAI